MRAFEFFGGVANAVVCDQLKPGVALACRYEPGIQRTYEEMAEHYGTTVLPARPARPRDKAKVEVAVQIVERWILARLRHHIFFSLDELNARMRKLLDEINDRRMKRYGASRRELFERLDRPALRALAAEPFRYGEWRHAMVSIDYHVEVEHHLYSVPHALVHEKVDARVTSTTVEIFHRNTRVASHAKSSQRGRHTTCPEHMPKAHQKHSEWTPSRMVRWGSTIGPSTAMLVDAILRERRHPEQGYRSCLGILRLSKAYGEARLEAAGARAVAVRARSYKHVASILKHGLDRLPPLAPATPMQVTLEEHENIRGEKYFN